MAITYRETGIIYRSGTHTYQGATHTALSMRARILVWPSISVKARILPSISVRARIRKQQGWPEPLISEIGQEGYDNFTFTLLTAKGTVSQPTFGKAFLWMGGRIDSKRHVFLTMQASIVSAGLIQMRASITPRVRYNIITASFDVVAVQNRAYRMEFYVTGGNINLRNIYLRSCIQGAYTTRVTGHFMVPMPVILSNGTMAIEHTETAYSKRGLQAKARIRF